MNLICVCRLSGSVSWRVGRDLMRRKCPDDGTKCRSDTDLTVDKHKSDSSDCDTIVFSRWPEEINLASDKWRMSQKLCGTGVLLINYSFSLLDIPHKCSKWPTKCLQKYSLGPYGVDDNAVGATLWGFGIWSPLVATWRRIGAKYQFNCIYPAMIWTRTLSIGSCLITLQRVTDLSEWCRASVGSVWLVSGHPRITIRLQSDKSNVADDNDGQISGHYQSFIGLGDQCRISIRFYRNEGLSKGLFSSELIRTLIFFAF